MTEVKVKDYTEFVLPVEVVTKSDLSHLVREVEQVENQLALASARHTATPSYKPHKPALSRPLQEFIKVNDIKFFEDQPRMAMLKQLRKLNEKISVVHVTFSGRADEESLRDIIVWFRDLSEKPVVLEVGLQPSLVAGIYIRTPNRVHDLSLRRRLDGARDSLVAKLEALDG